MALVVIWKFCLIIGHRQPLAVTLKNEKDSLHIDNYSVTRNRLTCELQTELCMQENRTT